MVPQFQRSYAWKNENVVDLLTDLGEAVGKEPEYFLGTLVFTRSGSSEFDVIDGQQRLATVSILIAQIRDYLHTQNDDRSATIESQFLLTRERRSQELRPKLRLNAKDHNFYERSIVEGDESFAGEQARLLESHERITSAAKLCRDYIAGLSQQTKDPAEKLLDWIGFIESNLKVVVVDVPDDTNAFMIFETLNDRGADLSIADLLKNYLFRRASDRIDEAEDAWNTMFATLEGVGGEGLVLTYIRHLWSSIHGATREKDLYKEIKSEKKSKRGAIDFADTLALHAPFYAAIVNPKTDFWTAYGASAREGMLALEKLRLEQFRPLILAILAELPRNEVAKTVRNLLACSVRFLVVGGLGGGTMERVYCEAALSVRGGTVKTAKQLATKLRPYVPSDQEFESAFRTARVSQAYLARYYLAALERTARGEAEPELVPNENEQQVTLEHVLPRTPSREWQLEDEERSAASALHRRIGNLCLLRQRINSEAGNADFATKRMFLEASSFLLTKRIAEQTTWGENEIDSRQERLAQLAVKTWSLKA